MKVFIVFLSLLVLNVSFLSYQGDMDRYQKLQVFLKAAAEEGAAGGALYQDREAYGRGLLIINQNEAEKYIARFMKDTEEKLQGLSGEISYRIEIFDDEKGYGGCREYGLAEGAPALRLSIELKCRDLFRLPFLTVNIVRRSAVYQWENRYGTA